MRWVALILVFAMSLVCAQTEVAIPIPPQQFSLPANITVNGTIDLENVNITFVHEISNPYNETVSLSSRCLQDPLRKRGDTQGVVGG